MARHQRHHPHRQRQDHLPPPDHPPPQTVTISVTDNGGTATTPHIEHPTLDAQGGRGLALVTALATTVQIRRDPTGHTVTAELLTGPPDPTARGPHPR
ncbi:ATP-binding protein [Streptomyces specialis]|uniref:ATP-binding protein n=1 Tax=Streptomyces specialis TaxID=498367 RepID=UPI000D15043E|nr:ATP-binding protein [Streptomyces specialis]